MAGERYNTTEDLLAQYIPPEGISIDSSGNATDPEQQKLLDRQREKEEEEESSPSPLAMGLLQLGASMMRDEGWRDRPITLGESLGKAIPRGIAGYYNQDALNRQYEGEAAQQQMLEDQAEATRLQEIEAQNEKVKRYKAFVANVESTPDAAFGRTPGSASNRKQNLIQMFLDNPEKAMKALEDIWAKQAEIANRVPAKKTRAEMLGEKDDAQLEKIKKLLPSLVYQVMEDPDIPQEDREQFAFMYGKPEYLNPEQLKGAIGKAAELTSMAKAKDHSIEFKKHYDWLKEPERWKTYSPREQQQIEFIAQDEDPKAALASLKKLVNERKYTGDWDILGERKIKRAGRWVTVRKEKNYSTQQTREVEIDGAYYTTRESMSGNKINEDFAEYFPDIKFDKDTMYNVEIVNGKPFLLGGIFDMTKKDPGKAMRYADEMRKSAVAMGLINDKEAGVLMSQPPADQIKTINKILIDNKAETPDTGDPNEGLIKSGEEINKEQKELGRPEYATVGKNYYWDGKKWTDLKEGQAELVFSQEEDLRREYDKNTKKYKDSLFAYNSIIKGYQNSLDDPHAAGINDIMIVRAFLLMIEPNSVVRESEFATAARSQGLVNYSMNLLNKLEKGSILTQASRARFHNAATAYMTAVLGAHKLQRERYTKIAGFYNLSPGRIIDDPFANLPELKDFKGYTMTDKDREYLKNVKTIAPSGNTGIQENNSDNPPLEL